MASFFQRHVVKTTQSSTCRNTSEHDNDVDISAPTSRINGSVHSIIDCKKNPGHEKFIPIHDLKPDNLLRVFRGLGHIYIDLIRLKSHETVKLEVAYTSPKRPDELGFKELKGKSSLRNGSGTVFVLNMENEQPCQFSDCSEHQGPHNVQELKKQQHLDNEKTDRMVVLISHPHGYAKHVTIGRLIQLVKYENKVQVEGINVVSCQLSYTTPTSTGSEGGSVNIFDSKAGCIGFAPHCACGEKHKEGISGLGWTLMD